MSTNQVQWFGLPQARVGDVYCSVTVLNQSSLVLEESHFLLGGSDARVSRPTFCFLIKHPTTGENVIWDLGIRREYKKDHPHPSFEKGFEPHVEEDLSETLSKLNIAPTDIDKVLISHKHWDHTGNPAPYTKATIHIGAADVSHVQSLHPDIVDRIRPINFDSPASIPIAAFPNALDLYNDGSVYVVDAHGHTPGHINLLVRTGEDEWVLLASDGCHHTLLLSPDPRDAHHTFGRYRGYWEDESVEPVQTCYEDVEESQRHLDRMRACEAREDVMVVIAHNEDQWKLWYGNQRAYGPGPDLQGWREKGYKLSTRQYCW